MNPDWRNEPATEQQKEKLHFFGCTWDEGITAGQASDALGECARQFPDAEAATKSLPATEYQKAKLRFFGCTWNGDITVRKANDALAECARQFPDREAAWQFEKKKWSEIPVTSPTPEQFAEIRSFGKEPPVGLTFEEAKIWIEQCKILCAHKPRVTDENLPTPINLEFLPESKRSDPKYLFPPEPMLSDAKYLAWDTPHGREYGFALAHLRWEETVKQIKAQIEAEKLAQQSKDSPEEERKKQWNDWVALHERLKERQNKFDKESSQEVTIQEAAKPQNANPNQFTIPARAVQDYAQTRPAIQKPASYNSAIPIERFANWLDIVLKRNVTCLGGHWLPVGPVCYPFKQYTSLTIGLCGQIAEAIESRGYCVEPDARFGNGKYDAGNTLALFKPFDGDPIKPSSAYLGAANLLRLCVIIATADGQIDLAELDVFRKVIENQIGLSKTDHKRLLVLEQLLAQELASASKIISKIAKSIPADKRFVVGKLLVEVAAANNVVTNGERGVLEEIFTKLNISLMMLKNCINQFCPKSNSFGVQSDISAENRYQWNNWRTNHPGLVIDDTTLAGMVWNFNDWRALNARWQDLHERLVTGLKKTGKQQEASSQPTGTRGSREPVLKPVVALAPRAFTLDMAKVCEITRDTKEVVAILSVLMEDEPEKSIAPSATITLPAPEIPKVSGDGNAAPQPTRFNGLDAAFHPILNRLLARDSWPKNDFKSLADEFHFMPSKIYDTLNEWADEVLGEFILEGEDPVIIRRELIAKETIYG